MAFGPRNLTEYLFADKYGDISSDIDTREVNAVYLSYMQSLIDAYDRLKSKFNQLQTRCLSEKQKRECGVDRVAPTLIMPQEKDRQDEERDRRQAQGLNDTDGNLSSMGPS